MLKDLVIEITIKPFNTKEWQWQIKRFNFKLSDSDVQVYGVRVCVGPVELTIDWEYNGKD